MDKAESDFASLSILKTIISHRHMRPGEQDFGQRERNAMLRLIYRILSGVEYVSHGNDGTPLA